MRNKPLLSDRDPTEARRTWRWFTRFLLAAYFVLSAMHILANYGALAEASRAPRVVR
jgi:hypothetical protein